MSLGTASGILGAYVNTRSVCNLFTPPFLLIFTDRAFTGQLYRADPETKEWSQVGSGITTVTILPGERRIVASKGKDKVWE